jgi:hypothetical protein
VALVGSGGPKEVSKKGAGALVMPPGAGDDVAARLGGDVVVGTLGSGYADPTSLRPQRDEAWEASEDDSSGASTFRCTCSANGAASVSGSSVASGAATPRLTTALVVRVVSTVGSAWWPHPSRNSAMAAIAKARGARTILRER